MPVPLVPVGKDSEAHRLGPRMIPDVPPSVYLTAALVASAFVITTVLNTAKEAYEADDAVLVWVALGSLVIWLVWLAAVTIAHL